ncbi:MAG: putative inorganic carbon (HCO3(-)) transporter [Candidatus Omnitrophota bacterium]|jgi:putative inorganic carbon (HCO3(-)) transporter
MENSLRFHLHNIKLFGFAISLIGSGFSISLCGIGLGIYGFAFLCDYIMRKETQFKRPLIPAHMLLGILLTSLFISLALSDYFAVSLKGYFKYVQSFGLLYAGIDSIRSKIDLKIILFCVLGVYITAVLDALYQCLNGADIFFGRTREIYNVDRNIYRLTGPYKQSTDFGTFLATGIPVVVTSIAWFWIKGKRALAALVALVSVCMVYVLLGTLSRGALFALFVGLFVLILHLRLRWYYLGVLLISLLVLMLVPSVISERMSQLMSGGSSPERVLLITIVFDMIQASPFFGLGLNTYSINFPLFKPEEYTALMYAHNGYLQIAAEAGCAGILLYISFIGALLFKIRQYVMQQVEAADIILGLGLLAGIVTLLTNGLFESVFQSTQLRTLLWVMLGIASSFAYRVKRSSNQGE